MYKYVSIIEKQMCFFNRKHGKDCIELEVMHGRALLSTNQNRLGCNEGGCVCACECRRDRERESADQTMCVFLRVGA